MSIPYLDFRNADGFEDVTSLPERYADPNYAFALRLLKIRLLADLEALENATAIREKYPTVNTYNIRERLVSSINARSDGLLGTGKLARALNFTLSRLRVCLRRRPAALPCIGRSGGMITMPNAYSRKTQAEMQLAFR
ncbi:hypothetical protein LTR37_010909 [Vermiconidia calcicola]|uniref:Uncharacterized protein n=1 Tax=Vermiconidia calcicola TaxID=1690605 RepID=A0ACC3N402_9PEZI|nr:hypothetical protein LTR37_010909 [Vermiconidia calcicola]